MEPSISYMLGKHWLSREIFLVWYHLLLSGEKKIWQLIFSFPLETILKNVTVNIRKDKWYNILSFKKHMKFFFFLYKAEFKYIVYVIWFWDFILRMFSEKQLKENISSSVKTCIIGGSFSVWTLVCKSYCLPRDTHRLLPAQKTALIFIPSVSLEMNGHYQ